MPLRKTIRDFPDGHSGSYKDVILIYARPMRLQENVITEAIRDSTLSSKPRSSLIFNAIPFAIVLEPHTC